MLIKTAVFGKEFKYSICRRLQRVGLRS